MDSQRTRSELLSRILQQMNYRQAQFQPQNYGALAAGLGAQLADAYNVKNQMGKQQQQEQARAQAISQALSKATQQQQGGMQTLPGTGVQLDTLPDQKGAIASLLSNPDLAQAAAPAIMGGIMNPPQAEEFTLTPGAGRYRGGQLLASQPLAPEKPPSAESSIGKLQADFKAGLISPEQYKTGLAILSKPLVNMGDTGPQFPTPPASFYRPDKNTPGLVPEPGAPPAPGKELSGEIKAKLGLLNSARESLNEAKGILFKDGAYRSGLASQMLNPLRTGPAADLYNSMFEAMSNRLRAESGANISDTEIKSQTDRFVPKPWDSAEVAANKFMRFERFIQQYEKAVSYDPAQPSQESAQPSKGNVLRFDKNGNQL